MACGSCGRKSKNKNIDTYDIFGGVSIKSLNSRQIEARLNKLKRKNPV